MPMHKRVMALDRNRELASATLTGLEDLLLVEAVLPSVQNRYSQVQHYIGGIEESSPRVVQGLPLWGGIFQTSPPPSG